MATRTKAKAKASPAATKAKTKAKPKVKAKAPKAPSPVLPTVKLHLPIGSFVTFQGYASDDMTADEKVFSEGAMLYIVDTDVDAGLYNAIAATDIEAYQRSGFDNIEAGQVAPREVKSLKGSALTHANEKYVPIPDIGDMQEYLNAADGDILEAAVQLNQDINSKYFYLGGLIAKILQDEIYLQGFKGDDAFNDFCQETFAFKASKAHSLARLYLTFSAIPNFNPSQLDAVGWTKAAIAERYVTPDNVTDVLSLAAEAPQRELAVQLKEKYESAGNMTPSGKSSSRGPRLTKTKITFVLEEDSAESVKLAIAAAKKQTGIESDALALERICVEWANDHVEVKKTKSSIHAKANKARRTREKAAKEGAAKPK